MPWANIHYFLVRCGVRGFDRLDRYYRYGGDRQSHIKAHLFGRPKMGTFRQAIGRSRDGRTTKIHALTDAEGKPRALLLSAGHTHDIMLVRSSA